MIDTDERIAIDTDDRAGLAARVAELETQVADLREWVAELGDDLIERTR